MKITLPAVTLCAILSPDKILSKAESINFAMAATDVKKEVKAYEVKEEEPKEEIDWDERSKRLKEKLNMMADLRTKLQTRGGYLVKSTKECRPHGRKAEDKKGSDVGLLLGCGSSGDIFCIQDSSSSLGGVCAQAVISEGGYGDETLRYEHEEGGVSSRFEKGSILEPFPESMAKSILQSAKDGGTIGEECIPGTNEGYVEIGGSNPCKSSDHVCLKDASSSLGGNCVDAQVFWGFIPKSWSDGLNIQKQTCTFKDGSSGTKCDTKSPGATACIGLSSDFIKNHIGCGSCNAMWACNGSQDDRTFVGENSCNQWNACAFSKGLSIGDWSCNQWNACASSTGSVGNGSCNQQWACNFLNAGSIGHGSCTAAWSCSSGRLKVGDRSCDGPFSCNDLKGSVTIGSDSCSGSYACKGDSNLTPITTTIGSNSCNKDGACSFLSGTTTIGNLSCNHCYSCSHSEETTKVQDESCNAPFACAYALGNTDIKSKSCIGSGACEYLAGTSVVGERSCLGVGSCKVKKDTNSIQSSALTVGNDACLGCYACNSISGKVSISSGSCYGFAACRNLVSEVSIGSNSCREIKTCSDNKPASIVTIGDKACNDVNNCNLFSGSVMVSNNMCNSDNSLANKNLCRLAFPPTPAVAKLRGVANTPNIGCLPNVQKVKLQHVGAAESMQGFELQVTVSGVNVAEQRILMKSDVSWEVDLEDSFLINSVSVLNTWCNESSDPKKCLCNLTGATLLLIDGNEEEITSVLVGDTCGQETVEFVFDASPEFCKPAVEHLRNPGLAPTSWKKVSRALAPRGCK